MATSIVQLSRPALANVRRTFWKVDVQATVVGHFADLCAHFAGSKFRLATHRFIDWNAPTADTILEVAPTAGPHTHRVLWQSSPFATHVGVVLGYQAFAASNDPSITAALRKRDGTDIDADGVVWTVANGGLVARRDFLREDMGPVYVWRHPILYTTSTARQVEASAIAGATAPRLLNVGSEAGEELTLDLEVEWARIHFALVFEAFMPSITQP